MTGSPLPRSSSAAVVDRAVAIALERGCRDAARLLEHGHRFPRRQSAMKPAERRAWAALVAARQEA